MADFCTDMKKKVAVIGLGLLGGSFGMALKGKGFHRIGWARRPEVRVAALAAGALDEVTETAEEAVAKADITVLALPIPQILRYLELCAPHFRSGSLVTDMGSVKGVICRKAEEVLTPRGIVFTGSHPMAGTEKSGFENAFPELYGNADAFLTPCSLTQEDHLRALEELWKAVGIRKTVRIDPATHDDLVAHTSHVLHIVASALALTILESDDPAEKTRRFAGCATGFRDTSRIASSNPAMWREIIENNTPANLTALKNFEDRLRFLRKMIEKGDYDGFEREFARGKELRDSWVAYKARRS